jgi:NAD(P)-dependent dehydrogenase (short-subunit alcohol dehydrogenase family)
MNTLSKTALVTCAARGIGLAIASRLVADGARVALLDLDGAAAAPSRLPRTWPRHPRSSPP